MPFGQNWLNAWVKVNSKHVVFPPNNKTEKDGSRTDLSSSAHHSVKHQNQTSSTTGSSSVATAPTAASEDRENQAIRRVNSRKHKRRLQRTVSATDLTRDKAKGKGAHDFKKGWEPEPNDDYVAPRQIPISKSSNAAEQDYVPSDNKPYPPQHDVSSVAESDDSLRFIAGFFGSDIESYGSGHVDSATASALRLKQNGGRYPDDAATASVHMPEFQKGYVDAASIVSRGAQSAPPRATAPTAQASSRDQEKQQQGGLVIRFPPNPFAGNDGKQNCRSCRRLEDELISAQEDLEYLRSTAVRGEYVCSTCEKHSSSGSRDQSPELIAVKEANEKMNTIVAQHKAEIDQLSRERARWQQDTHSKLQQFANLCKELNEEAAIRNEEAISLHHELDQVRVERDQLATDVKALTARLDIYERERKEQSDCLELVRKYEQDGLDGANRAIQLRDEVIMNLTNCLERALNTLEMEREQQRQRRKIIFPSRPSNAEKPKDELENELKVTKEAYRDSKVALEALRLQAQQNEAAQQARIEELEKQLRESQNR